MDSRNLLISTSTLHQFIPFQCIRRTIYFENYHVKKYDNSHDHIIVILLFVCTWSDLTSKKLWRRTYSSTKLRMTILHHIIASFVKPHTCRQLRFSQSVESRNVLWIVAVVISQWKEQRRCRIWSASGVCGRGPARREQQRLRMRHDVLDVKMTILRDTNVWCWLDDSSCFPGSILLLRLIGHLQERCTLDMSHPIWVSSVSSSVSKSCPLATVFMKSASRHSLINRILSGRFENFRSYSRNKSPCSDSLVRSVLNVVDKSVGTSMSSDLSSATGRPSTFWTVRNSRGQLVTHIRYRSVDTELIDGNNRAKNHFDCICFTTEVCRQFLISFTS